MLGEIPRVGGGGRLRDPSASDCTETSPWWGESRGGLKAAALCEINGMTVHMAYVPLKSRLGWKLLYTPKALWPKNSKPVFKPWCFVVNI